MWVRLSAHRNPRPSQLLDGDKRFVDMGILGHKERAKMQGEFLGVEDVGRCLCQDCTPSMWQSRQNTEIRLTIRYILDYR